MGEVRSTGCGGIFALRIEKTYRGPNRWRYKRWRYKGTRGRVGPEATNALFIAAAVGTRADRLIVSIRADQETAVS